MGNEIGNFGYPGFDYAAQQTKIERRKALLQSITQQGMEPLPTNRMAGGYAIPISPFEGLNKLAQNAYAGFGGKALEKEQSDLATKAQGDYRMAMATALRNSGLEQSQIDSLTAAGSNPMAAQSMPFIVSIAQQQRKMKMLQDWINNQGGGGAPAGGAGTPEPGAGTVLAPGMSGAPQGGGAAPQGGGMGNMPVGARNVLGGAMFDMPGLTELGKMQFEQSKPIVQREGGLTDWQGNQITPPLPKAPEGFGLNRTASGYELYPLPGAQAVPAFKGQEAGAVTRAQTENSLHPATRANGAVVPTLGSALMPPQAPPQGQPIQPQGAGPIPIPNAPQPGQPPGIAGPQPLAIPDQQQPIVRPMPQQGAAPQGRPLAIPSQGGPMGPAGTGRMQRDPWATMPRMPTLSGVGQSTYQKMTAENQAKQAASMIEEHSKTAQEANGRMAINDQALALVDKADTGPGAATIADVKNVLVSRFGIPESDFTNTPSATMVLNKDLMNAAIVKARAVFNNPRMTQMEVMQYLSKGAPNIDMPKAAMKFLITSDNAQAKYAIQQSGDLARYLNNGGDPSQFQSWYAKAFPMTNVLKEVESGGGQSGSSKPDALAPPSDAITATNPKTGQKIISHDGGKSWQAQ